MDYYEIPNYKFQIPNKSQYQMTKITNQLMGFGHWNFGNCILFVIWCLEFGI